MTVTLASIPNVELMQAGTWSISTGTVTFTPEDLAAAVAARDCPAVRRPVLKLGHQDPRFDGEPAVGWVENMRVNDDGFTLLGDYTNMPAWLAAVCASAYPDRSIEGQYDFVCQIGHTHPFVVTAVALLGVTEPGVGTLDSLQDVATLFGVAAAAESPAPATVTPRTFRTTGGPMPVAATISVEDVRREFYEDAPFCQWIVVFSLDPLQLIVADDEEGGFLRVPITLAADDTFTFGPPTPVVQTFVDVPPATEDGEGGGTDVMGSKPVGRVVFASRAESRPAVPTPLQVHAAHVAATTTPAAVPAAGSQREVGMDAVLLRTALGLTAEATDDEVRTALAANDLAAATEAPAPVIPEGMAVIDADTLTTLQVAAAAGQDADRRLREQERDNALTNAIKAGKFAPSRREHYATLWQADPEGTKTLLASLAPGIVAVEAAGYAGEAEPTGDVDSEFDRLFPPTVEV